MYLWWDNGLMSTFVKRLANIYQKNVHAHVYFNRWSKDSQVVNREIKIRYLNSIIQKSANNMYYDDDDMTD